eukprot:scaffold98546_cov65-Phaeocystis_antarctica.AAC.1
MRVHAGSARALVSPLGRLRLLLAGGRRCGDAVATLRQHASALDVARGGGTLRLITEDAGQDVGV